MPQAIADYALLGDCHGAALAGRDGSIDWWCPPRFDARSVFARILDPAAGHFSIAARGVVETTRRYLPHTLVLETTTRCAGGTVRLTEALALGAGRGHDLGAGSPHVLLRLVEAVEGEVELDVELAPRPDYGLVVPRMVRTPAGIASVGGPDRLTLVGDADLDVGPDRAGGRLALRAGDSAAFALHHGAGLSGPDPQPLDARAALRETIDAWQSWGTEHDIYDGIYREHVHRSAIVLKALSFQPSGAIVAAPTTSLPEKPGGSDNWDYRFAWLRDASLTLKALWVGACPEEAGRFFEFMAHAARSPHEQAHVQIMFGVQGERDLTEHELDHLAGHLGSRPVRVGNDAWRQRQLDVLGEVLEGAWVLDDQLGELSEATAEFLAGLADRAARDWRQKDSGIWEGREGERHYISSKLMCWTGLDRAIRMADRLGRHARPAAWAAAREDVREAILRDGWSERAGAFGGAFGSHHLDASALLMPIVGLLPATDPRMRRTIDAIESELSSDGLVQRWTGAGEEGSFVICSYWLATCRALMGEVDRARELFERITAHANDVGLLSEEIDIHSGELIGNFPQGFSHIGMINTAWVIERALERARQGGGPLGVADRQWRSDGVPVAQPTGNR